MDKFYSNRTFLTPSPTNWALYLSRAVYDSKTFDKPKRLFYINVISLGASLYDVKFRCQLLEYNALSILPLLFIAPTC